VRCFTEAWTKAMVRRGQSADAPAPLAIVAYVAAIERRIAEFERTHGHA
jgi:hypothetical protein